MKKIVLAAISTLVFSGQAVAEFKADVSSSDVRNQMSWPIVLDLAVGEIGIVGFPNFCLEGEAVYLDAGIKLSQQRNPYGANFIIKREPGNTISVSVEMGKESTKSTLSQELKNFVLGASYKECNLYPIAQGSLLKVSSVNGFSSFSEILSLKD